MWPHEQQGGAAGGKPGVPGKSSHFLFQVSKMSDKICDVTCLAQLIPVIASEQRKRIQAQIQAPAASTSSIHTSLFPYSPPRCSIVSLSL